MKITTIYIAHDAKQQIVDRLIEIAKTQFPNLEIVGAGPQAESSLKEIGICKPDFVISGQLSYEDSKTLLELSPNSKLLLLSTDNNRTSQTITDLELNGFYGHSYLDVNVNGPIDVLKFIADNSEKDEEEQPSAIEDFLAKGQETPAEEVKEDENTLIAARSDEIRVESANEKKASELALTADEDSRKEKVDIMSLKSKTIALYSRKGGTGNTLLCKEIAYVFGSHKLPKKIKNESEYLRVCLIDLDFEQGNVRTHLGIENPVPNVYMWIDDIVSKLEAGIAVDKITYNKMQVMSRFVKKVENEFYVLCTDQGPIPQRLVNSIIRLDKTGTLYKDIISLIIDSVRRAFDIVVIDTPSSVDECAVVAMEKADNVYLPIQPTVSDVENMKTIITELAQFETINLGKFGVIINRESKNSGIDDYLDAMIASVKFTVFDYNLGKSVEKTLPIVSRIPYDEKILKYENAFLSYTAEANSLFKARLLKVCENALPIFKFKPTANGKPGALPSTANGRLGIPNKVDYAGLIEAGQKAENIKKTLNGFPLIKEKPKAVDGATWKLYQKELKIQIKLDKGYHKKGTTEPEPYKIPGQAQNASKEEGTKKPAGDNPKTPEENASEAPKEENLYDFSKDDLKAFVKRLQANERVKKLPNGFPYIPEQPKTVSPKVWKQYNKELNKQIKAAKKAQKGKK